jgi:hypothetical protein
VSTSQALTITTIAVFTALALAWQILTAWAGDDEEHDVGPDGLRLLEDLDAHLDAHFARLAPLFEELGPPPADAAGCDRLRDAIRQQREDEQS